MPLPRPGRRVAMAAGAVLVAGGIAFIARSLFDAATAKPHLDTFTAAQQYAFSTTAVGVLDGASMLGSPSTCRVRLLGTEPRPETLGAADPSRIFVWAYCQGSPGSAEAVSVPAVVDLDAAPRVRVPVDGSLYGASINHLFPKRLHRSAFDGDNNLREIQQVSRGNQFGFAYRR